MISEVRGAGGIEPFSNIRRPCSNKRRHACLSEALAHTQCRDMHYYSICPSQTVIDMMSGAEAQAGRQTRRRILAAAAAAEHTTVCVHACAAAFLNNSNRRLL